MNPNTISILHLTHLKVKKEVPNFPKMKTFEFEYYLNKGIDRFFYNKLDEKLLYNKINNNLQTLDLITDYILSGFTIFDYQLKSTLYKELLLNSESIWDIFKYSNLYFDYFFDTENFDDVDDYYNSDQYKILMRGRKLNKLKNKIKMNEK